MRSGAVQLHGAADGRAAHDYLVWVNDTANVLAALVATYDVRDGANQGDPTRAWSPG